MNHRDDNIVLVVNLRLENSVVEGFKAFHGDAVIMWAGGSLPPWKRETKDYFHEGPSQATSCGTNTRQKIGDTTRESVESAAIYPKTYVSG